MARPDDDIAHNETNLATERLRQQGLKHRREGEGWKRLMIWLTPQEADTLQTLGTEWLGHWVKTLLAEQDPILHAGTRGDSIAIPDLVPLESKLAAAVLAERARTIALLFRLGKSARDIAQLLHLELSDVARVLAPPSEIFTLTGEPATLQAPTDQMALMQEVDTLLAQGLSGMEIARQFNAAGRRAANGAEYCGANLIRDWRRWKGASI